MFMKARSWATGASSLSTPTVSPEGQRVLQHTRPTHLLTRVAGADLALLLPRRRPRTSTALRSTRLPEPSHRFRRQLSTPPTASPRSSTNLALLTRRGLRASAALRGARLTLLRLRPRRHYRRCRRASLAPRPPTRPRLGCGRLWRCHLVSTRPPRSGGWTSRRLPRA